MGSAPAMVTLMAETLRIVYAGSPAFAVPALEQLAASGHHIVAAYTQPDRPAGRGRHARACPVKAAAMDRGIPVEQPESLKGPAARARLEALAPDAMIVAAYGQILPKGILGVPRFGCLNIHASLLPRWRGAAPIQRALLAGDSDTGVCLMRMAPGMDTGPVIDHRRSAISADDTADTLHERLARLGAELTREALPAYVSGELVATPQSEVGVTYAPKLTKAEAHVDWSQPARSIERQIRAFNPWPVAHTEFFGEGLRLWAAEVDTGQRDGGTSPGTIVAADGRGLGVATGDGLLWLTEVQPAGKQRQPAAAFINGYGVGVGDEFEA